MVVSAFCMCNPAPWMPVISAMSKALWTVGSGDMLYRPPIERTVRR